MNPVRSATFVASLATALLVAACGGGGGGGDGNDTAKSATPLTSSAGTPVSPPPAPRPAPGTEEKAAFELLNQERVRCGFGALERNAQLDTAAAGHASWMLLNDTLGHFQTSNTPGFTGESYYDRVLAAGYKNPVLVTDEFVFITGQSNTAGMGVQIVSALLAAPYHTRGMLRGFHDIGVSILSSKDVSVQAPRIAGQFNLAYNTSVDLQRAAPGSVRTYPCDGTGGTHTQLTNEIPSPIPNRNLALNPVGHPIYVIGDESQTLRINSAVVQERQTGNPIELRAPLTADNDPQHGLRMNEVFLIPDSPLKTNSTYLVKVTGTNGARPFDRAFTFSTGAVTDAYAFAADPTRRN